MHIILMGRLAEVLAETATELRAALGDAVTVETATTIAELTSLVREHDVAHVVSGAGLPLSIRLDAVREVFVHSDRTSVHLKDAASGPHGLAAFARDALGGAVAPAAVDVHLVVDEPARAAVWYEHVFGGIPGRRIALPSGRVVIAEVTIGPTTVALAPPLPNSPLTTPGNDSAACYHVRVPDADRAFHTALAEGAREFAPLQDAIWGERTGQFIDPFGHRWAVDQHLADVDDTTIAAALAPFFGEPAVPAAPTPSA